jgi:Holliday junction DNA helicase RuvB
MLVSKSPLDQFWNKPGDLAGLLTNLEERDVFLFMRNSPSKSIVENFMEDFKIVDIMIESG